MSSFLVELDVTKAREKIEDKKEDLEIKLNIPDSYFWDMRMWEKPFDLDNELTAILERNHNNNSGNSCYQIRQLNDKQKALEYLKPLMVMGISNMATIWKNELNGNYLKIYGEENFKKLYGYYSQLSKWLEENKQRGKTESYEYFLEKAKSEIQIKEDKEIEEKSKELKELLKKKFGYPVIIRVLRGDENAIMSGG